MIPMHAQIINCGTDGLTIKDYKTNEIFSVKAEALHGNGWLTPLNSPGGIDSKVFLVVNGPNNNGLNLADPDLGNEYWISNTGLVLMGCQPIKRPSVKPCALDL